MHRLNDLVWLERPRVSFSLEPEVLQRLCGYERNQSKGEAFDPHSTHQRSFAMKGASPITWVLRVILGVAFLLIGATKLTSTANTVAYFDAIGGASGFAI
jgi:hypothetical protein